MSASSIQFPSQVLADWVFAYGSLIWNPEFDFEHAERALLRGYHRAFCISSTRYRGTPEQPGVVLGLDRGGSCVGLAYRLRVGTRSDALDRLFEREMPRQGQQVYQPRIVRLDLASGVQVSALAFIADRRSPAYRYLTEQELLQRLACCVGARGPNIDYAINTCRALESCGFVDPKLRRITRLLALSPARH
jgi:cation transport protein ChaC